MNGYCWRNQKGRKFDISDNEFWIIFDLEIANFALFFSVTIIRQQYPGVCGMGDMGARKGIIQWPFLAQDRNLLRKCTR